ncbi:MAG: O-antigen ligase family protein [Elusimicrobiota bacterium]|nr:O-antigen ligase family protein [Endomicrobiia bacterium]MDW8166334.1 O-antigen ligase family protein [Elusimicrobiota bacterium]
MIELFGIFIFLNTFLPKIGFELKFLPFHLNIVDILYVSMLIYVLIVFRKKLFSYFYSLFTLFLWGIVSALVGYFNSAPLWKIIDEFLRQYIYIFVAVIAMCIIKNSREVNKIMFFFFLGICLLSLYGILEWIFTKKFINYARGVLLTLGYPKQASFFVGCDVYDLVNYRRVITTLLSWNSSGQYLASSLFLLLAKGLLDRKISISSRLIYLLISVICIITIIFTRSRSAWVGMFATAILFSIIVFKKRFWIFSLSFIIIITIFATAVPQIKDRIKSFLNLTQDGSAWGRIEAIKASLPVIKKTLLVGYGLGMFSSQKIPADYKMYAGLDCFYVRYIVSNGIIGLIIFLGTVFWLFRKVLIKIKSSYININWLLIGSVCGLFVLLIGALFDCMLAISTYMSTLFWFYFGLILKEVHEKR